MVAEIEPAVAEHGMGPGIADAIGDEGEAAYDLWFAARRVHQRRRALLVEHVQAAVGVDGGAGGEIVELVLHFAGFPVDGEP